MFSWFLLFLNLMVVYISTRVVQKLIETLKTRQQIALVTLALESGFLDLIKDLNGNHVIQRCLQCLSKEDNRVMFSSRLIYDLTRRFVKTCLL